MTGKRHLPWSGPACHVLKWQLAFRKRRPALPPCPGFRRYCSSSITILWEKTQGYLLQGKLNAERYGLPFLGDNQFLIDRIALQQQPSPAFWYRRLDSSDQELIEHTARFTIWIDRADMSRTSSALYAPTDTSLNTPPDSAWTEIAPP